MIKDHGKKENLPQKMQIFEKKQCSLCQDGLKVKTVLYVPIHLGLREREEIKFWNQGTMCEFEKKVTLYSYLHYSYIIITV